jgi:hypothetical protein
MSNTLAFPLKFKRQYSGSLDADLNFATLMELNAYLTDGARYPGQIVSCTETEGKIYVLNTAGNAWIGITAATNYKIVDTLIQRNELQEFERINGMICYVLETNTEYRLVGNSGVPEQDWNFVSELIWNINEW